MSAIALDPLIAEAKERVRRRRLLALGAAAAVAVAGGTTLALRPSGNSRGICASTPSGWKERTLANVGLGPPTVVLTNFRFGRMGDVFGLSDPRIDWRANSVMIAVGNWPPRSTVSSPGTLQVTGANFAGMEGVTRPVAHLGVRSDGRILDTYVEVGALTPATVAAANEALAGVQVCSS